MINFEGRVFICHICGAHSKLSYNEPLDWVIERNNNMCPECLGAFHQMIRDYRLGKSR